MPFEGMLITSFLTYRSANLLKGKWAKKINSVWDAVSHVVSIACSWENFVIMALLAKL